MKSPASNDSAASGFDLFAPVDNDLIVYFRIIVGASMAFWVSKLFTNGLLDAWYVKPPVHFHYDGFFWVQPLPAQWMRIHFATLGISAVFVCVGLFYRVASVIMAIGFSYAFLIDKALYQNHYYLLCLVAWLLVALPAHRDFSVDTLIFRDLRCACADRWTVWIVRFVIALPYVFGGIAKMSPDWFACEPMRMMLAERTWYPAIGSLFKEEWFVQLFSWGGLIFDLMVVPGLLFRPTRTIAFGLAVGFHIMNATLFTIGIFPWFMILATVVFVDPGRIRGLFVSAPQSRHVSETSGMRKSVVKLVLAIFVLFQVLMPLRHFVMPGDPNWNEEGHYFAWHMMLRGKLPAVRYLATDPETGRSGSIPLDFITPFQMKRFARDPRMIHELACFVADDLRTRGFPGVEIRVLALVSMNGRKPQLMIDPDVDLAAQPRTWSVPTWIVPLREPLRDEPWSVPIMEWEERLGLKRAGADSRATASQPDASAQ